MNSTQFEESFVVETNNDGQVGLRFGNDMQGRMPEPDTEFTAYYRIGNGVSGNIGVDAISHLVANIANTESILEVRNLLPARGGIEIESMHDVRYKAPYAYRTQERAVTEAESRSHTEHHMFEHVFPEDVFSRADIATNIRWKYFILP